LFQIQQHLKLTPKEVRAVAELIQVLPLAGHICALGTANKDNGLMMKTDLYDALMRRVHEGPKLGLVVLDPLARLFPGAESSNTLATGAVQFMEGLCKGPGAPTTFVSAHSSKMSRREGSVDTRGVTGLPDAARFEMLLSEEGKGYLKLKFSKSNYAGKPDALQLRRVEDAPVLRLATQADREAQEDAIASESDERVKQDLWCSMEGPARSHCSRPGAESATRGPRPRCAWASNRG
jgi:hypothetical protein